jgi:hypothetical protein
MENTLLSDPPITDTIVLAEAPATVEPTPPPSTDEPTPTPPPSSEVPLVSVPIINDNTALNVLVAFVGIAQKRGAFNIQEAAKIWECIQQFSRQMPTTA